MQPLIARNLLEQVRLLGRASRNFADRLVVMYGGLILEEGPVAEVIARPGHPYTAGLLASLVTFGSHHSRQALHMGVLGVSGGTTDVSD